MSVEKVENLKKIFKEYLEKGIISVVENDDHKGFYSPLLLVFKESSSTPCRPVLDCSMKSDLGVSINNLQLIGENNYERIADLLMRFRLHKVGLSLDIKQMYLSKI